MSVVTIDLVDVTTKDDLLTRIGDVLELGGTGDIGQRPSPTSGSGWGRNWDALSDSLRYLDSGGIWGTGRPLTFPLSLRFENSKALRAGDPESVRLLVEILEGAASKYEQHGMSLTFEFS